MSCIQQNFPSKFEPNDAFYEKLEENTFVAFILRHPVCSVYLSRGVHEFGNWIDDSVFSCTSIGPFRVIRGKILVCLPSLFSLHLLAWNVFQRKLTILCRSKIFPLHDFLILFRCVCISGIYSVTQSLTIWQRWKFKFIGLSVSDS